MLTLHLALLLLAAACFIVAAIPNSLSIRFEWLGAACVVLAWLT